MAASKQCEDGDFGFSALLDRLPPPLSEIAHRGMILVLFLIGTSLSLSALRVVGWRTVATGLVLWLFISVASLLAICGLHLAS